MCVCVCAEGKASSSCSVFLQWHWNCKLRMHVYSVNILKMYFTVVVVPILNRDRIVALMTMTTTMMVSQVNVCVCVCVPKSCRWFCLYLYFLHVNIFIIANQILIIISRFCFNFVVAFVINKTRLYSICCQERNMRTLTTTTTSFEHWLKYTLVYIEIDCWLWHFRCNLVVVFSIFLRLISFHFIFF